MNLYCRPPRTLKNRKGFTLIELMIVIAIIGLLAAIVAPLFIETAKEKEERTLQECGPFVTEC